MVRSISIFFILLHSLIIIRPIMPVIEYHLKLEAYKAKCVNLASPDMHCNGTCQLQTEVKAQEEEQGLPLPVSSKYQGEDHVFVFEQSRLLHEIPSVVIAHSWAVIFIITQNRPIPDDRPPSLIL